MKRKPFSATNQPPYTRTEAPIIHGRIIFFFFFSVSNSSKSWNVKRVRQPIWKPVHTLCIRLSNRPYRVASSNLPVTVGFLWWCWDWSYGIFVWFRLQPQEFQFISFHQFADYIAVAERKDAQSAPWKRTTLNITMSIACVPRDTYSLWKNFELNRRRNQHKFKSQMKRSNQLTQARIVSLIS